MSTSGRALSVVLAGGGSAGHVNPLLALADCLSRHDPQTVITVLGTSQGLEARLVPERGYRLRTVPKVPFPRRPGLAVIRFPGALRRAVAGAAAVLTEVGADVVVGFGGYVATPAYLAARRTRTPIVIHEQNARPGLANRLGARFTPHVATTFEATRLPHATVVGLPLRQEVADLDRAAARPEALEHFGLSEDAATLLVFGGSLGALRLNTAFAGAARDLAEAGVQVLHLTGAGKELEVADSAQKAGSAGSPDLSPPYRSMTYTDRMDLAYAVADLAVCRAGAGTVCELSAVGVPAIYVPLPVGNGEQRLNAADVVAAGGGLLVEDERVTAGWVRDEVIPLLGDADRLAAMGRAAAVMGHRDADDTLARMVLAAAGPPGPDPGRPDPDPGRPDPDPGRPDPDPGRP